MATEPFTPPPTYVGQMVIHKRSPKDPTGAAAIVTAVGTGVVAVARMDPGMVNHLPYDGVRHESDPRAQQSVDEGDGVWCHLDKTPGYLAYHAFATAGRSPKAPH